MSRRVDDFEGTVDEYLAYLENIIVVVREHHDTHHSTCAAAPHARLKATVAYAQGKEIPMYWSSILTCLEAAHVESTSEHEPLQILIEKPGGPKAVSSRKRLRPDDTAISSQTVTWERTAQSLLEVVPRHQDWRQTLQKKKVYHYVSEGMFLEDLLGGTTNRLGLQGHTVGSSVLQAPTSVARLQDYAHSAAALRCSAEAALGLAHFQQFIVLSACAVLLDLGEPSQDTVYDIAKVCMGTSMSNDHCLKLLRTACFLNKLIDRLNAGKVGKHASELVLVCRCDRCALSIKFSADIIRESPGQGISSALSVWQSA